MARLILPKDQPQFTNGVLGPSNRDMPKYKRARRSQVVGAACEECRLKKLRCNGGRPKCQRCVDKKLDHCQYEVKPGETRYTTLKIKNQDLAKDRDAMLELIDSLRSVPRSEAETLLDSLRSSSNPLAFVQSYHEGRTLESSSPQPAPSSSNLSPERTPTTAGSPAVASAIHQGPGYSYLTPPSSVTTPDAQQSSQLPRAPIEDHSPEPIVATVESSVKNLAGLPHGVFIPEESNLEEAVSAFFRYSGRLFHVFTRPQIEHHYDALYRGNDDKLRRLAACELCALASIGSQYMQEPLSPQQEKLLYRTSLVLLEEEIEFDTLRATKVCALLAMMNIINKKKIALAFVDIALNLARRLGLHHSICPIGMRPADWFDGRKVWVTLLFFESWLGSTLGYVPAIEPSIPPLKDVDAIPTSSFEDLVQLEMVKIAILKFNLLRTNLSFKGLSILSIDTITYDLRQWHRNLPAGMQLSNLLRDHNISRELRRTIYFIHLLYLGGLILISRRVIQQANDERDRHLIEHSRDKAAEFVEEATLAAKQSSRILGLLRAEDGIFGRCWLCIFQSYSSCVLIMHGVAQDLLHAHNRIDTTADLACAAKCLDVLQFCSPTDTTAVKFYGRLQPYYDFLNSLVSPSPHTTAILNPDAHLQQVASELVDLVCKPFRTPGQPKGTGERVAEAKKEANDLVLVDALESICEAPHSFAGNWQEVDGVTNDGIINDLLSGRRPPQFLETFESSSWASEYGKLRDRSAN